MTPERMQELAPCLLHAWHIPFANAIAREARAEALEEAARVCDAKANELDPGDLGLANNRKAGIACGMCAAAIRALRGEGEGRTPETQPLPAEEMCPNCVTPWKCNGPHRPLRGEGAGR